MSKIAICIKDGKEKRVYGVKLGYCLGKRAIIINKIKLKGKINKIILYEEYCQGQDVCILFCYRTQDGKFIYKERKGKNNLEPIYIDMGKFQNTTPYKRVLENTINDPGEVV